MKALIPAIALWTLLCAGSAGAVTIEAEVDGPLLKRASLITLFEGRLAGALTGLPDVANGGNHRLRLRLSSKYIQHNTYTYLLIVDLQRRIVERDTGNVYWASVRNSTSLNDVPSETELRAAIVELVERRINTWTVD